MFFPYSTDAPIYHWPVTTVALILVNIAVFCGIVAVPGQTEPFALTFGDGLHPIQWLTCNFLHGNFWHLIGNMLFLWSFGLIVEGKLGWLKTLLIYLAIGIVHGAVVQLLMLYSVGAALGASGAIYGFMAMSLIWAPENEMECLLLIRICPFFFQMKVVSMVGLFVLTQVAVTILTGLAMGSNVLHLVGAALGFVVAIGMLKTGCVDCEGWDAFSVWAGRETTSAEERDQQETARQAGQRGDGTLTQTELVEQFRQILRGGDALLAFRAQQRLRQVIPEWSPSRTELWDLIRALHAKRLLSESVPLMEEYVAHHDERAGAVRLRLAQILASVEKRPDYASTVLARVDPSALTPSEREAYRAIRSQAARNH
ncbi:MAG: rhomboid family intramembrane serine protease [Thermoguttaceae bacterium]